MQKEMTSPSTQSQPVESLVSETYDELLADVSACATLESLVCGKGTPKPIKTRSRCRPGVPRPAPKAVPFNAYERVSDVVKACRYERKRAPPNPESIEVENAELHKMARFTHGLALQDYAPFLHYVPRLVNIVSHLAPWTGAEPLCILTRSPSMSPQVTLAEAIPVKGSGITLPLDLFKIASRCNGAYFASKRFAAVQVHHLHGRQASQSICSLCQSVCSQLAYTHPRCRVLVFREHTVDRTTRFCVRTTDSVSSFLSCFRHRSSRWHG